VCLGLSRGHRPSSTEWDEVLTKDRIWHTGLRASTSLRAAEIEHKTPQTGSVRSDGFDDRIRYRLKFVATKARWNQEDAGMLSIGRHRLMGEFDEIDYVGRYDSPSFSRCMGELGPIVQLNIADVLRCGDIHAALSKTCGNGGRQVLIEIELHRVKRTSPGNRLSVFSGVRAALASILA